MKKTLHLPLLLLLVWGISAFDGAFSQTENPNTWIEAPSSKQKNFRGLALYTVRDAMAKDPKATLQAVADAGYTYIEATGYSEGKFYGMEPLEFKSYLNSISLIPKSIHQSAVNLNNADQMMADVAAAGFEYFVIPVPPMGMFYFNQETKRMAMKGTADELANILNLLGEKSQKAGLKLLYHNHDFEFLPDANGTVIIDYLLANCPPELVNFQMDLFWVTKAGRDPIVYFKEYPGRFKGWHVKDISNSGVFAPVGTGTIDFKRILAARKLSGMEYYFVEQDDTFELDPIKAIKISHQGLREIGFK